MSMAAIELIVFAGAAGFALVVVIFIIVIIGSRQEERYLTFIDRDAPSATAQLARIVLGRYVRKEYDHTAESGYPCYPDDRIGARERTLGPRR
jgi:hypothetical protein